MPFGDRLCVTVATGVYLSYIPCWLSERLRLSRKRWTGAGFIGALLGWATVYALPRDPAAFGLVLAISVVLASFISGRAERAFGTHDDPRIIVDEIVGLWTAAWGHPRGPGILLAAFVLFRILDVAKLPPYRSLERLPGGWGIVLDDVGAGLVANLALRCALWPLVGL